MARFTEFAQDFLEAKTPPSITILGKRLLEPHPADGNQAIVGSAARDWKEKKNG